MKGLPFFFYSIGRVFFFFFAQGWRIRRTKVFILIGLLPVAMAALIRIPQAFSQSEYIRGMTVFSNMIMVFYLQFFILILALFFGSSVCSEEIESKTLTYLTTRPVGKSAVVLGKYAAYLLLMSFIVVAGIILAFIILNFENLLDLSLYKVLFRDIGVLLLGLICYTAFFTFLGSAIKKSILFGLIFAFGWENVIQYFPGSTQKFTIVHYLKSLLPAPVSDRFSFLTFRLESTSPGMSIFMLFLIAAGFLFLACLVFTYKEYIFED